MSGDWFGDPGAGAAKRPRPRSVAAQVREATVLVVGGAGYIGSMLSARLVRAGYDVIVLDPLWYGDAALSPLAGWPNFELRVGDTRDEELTRSLVRRASKVVHLGEIVGDPACDLDPLVTESVNFAATARLARMAAEAGVERFVYASSCSVYGANDEIVDEMADPRPVSLYGHLKVSAEREILALASDEFHPTIFRLATVYGRSHRPRFDLVVNALAGQAVVDHRIAIQGGGQWRPFVHVDDVAATLCEALEHPIEEVGGEIFNLGSNDQNHTVLGVADIVRGLVPDTEVEVSPVRDHRNYRVSFDKLRDGLRVPGQSYRERRRGGDRHRGRFGPDPRHSGPAPEQRPCARRDGCAAAPLAGRPRRRRPGPAVPASRPRGQAASRRCGAGSHAGGARPLVQAAASSRGALSPQRGRDRQGAHSPQRGGVIRRLRR